MEHLLLKAATTATDQGTFTAVISTVSVDRDKDIIEPSAMVASLAKWAALGKLVPLAYNHTDEVIGHIDPKSVQVRNGEVIAKGFVDQSTPRGADVWRLVKSGTLSFSFGFLYDPKTAEKLANGRHRVKELDVFEISAIPVGPANNDTRVLSFKRLAQDVAADALKGLQAEVEKANDLADGVARITSSDAVKALADVITSQVVEHGDVAVATELQDVKARLCQAEKALEDLTKGAEETDHTGSVDPLKQSAHKLALEIRSGGVSTQPPRIEQAPEPVQPEPEMNPDELRKRSRDLMLQVLSGDTK